MPLFLIFFLNNIFFFGTIWSTFHNLCRYLQIEIDTAFLHSDKNVVAVLEHVQHSKHLMTLKDSIETTSQLREENLRG